MSKKYTVLSRIWHTGENRYYEPGAEVSLDHLNADEIERLLLKGIVAPVPVVRKKAESKPPKIEKVTEVEDGTDE